MNAARQVVVPIQAEATSIRALELLFDQIESIEQGLKIDVRVLAVVPNLVQDSAMSKRILADLHREVPDLVRASFTHSGRIGGKRPTLRTRESFLGR